MNRDVFFRYTVLTLLALSPIVGYSAVPANPKIAIIDIDNTLQSTPAGKRANDAFEKARKAKQGELDKQQDQLKKADADLDKQAQSGVLKPEVLKQKREELQKQFVTLQQTYMKLERDLAGERAKLIQDVLKQAGPKIEALAKAEGVTVILDREALIWADPNSGIDLTQKLNAEMK
jgi:Skp family chaperone for outer membrane proteins